LEKEIKCAWNAQGPEILDAQEDRRYGKGKLAVSSSMNLRPASGPPGQDPPGPHRRWKRKTRRSAAARQRHEEEKRPRPKPLPPGNRMHRAAEKADLDKKAEGSKQPQARAAREKAIEAAEIADVENHRIWSPLAPEADAQRPWSGEKGRWHTRPPKRTKTSRNFTEHGPDSIS